MTSLADCLSFWFSVDSPMGKLIPMTQKLRDARKKLRKKSCRGRQRLTQTQSVVNFDKNQTAGNKYFVKKTMFQSFILTDNLITPVVSCFFSEVRLCVGHRYQKSITDSPDNGKNVQK